MELVDRLREIMRKEFGIETDDQLMEAIDCLEGPDLGIFVAPLKAGVENAS